MNSSKLKSVVAKGVIKLRSQWGWTVLLWFYCAGLLGQGYCFQKRQLTHREWCMSEGNLYSSGEKKKARTGLKRFLNAKVKNIYFKRQLEAI